MRALLPLLTLVASILARPGVVAAATEPPAYMVYVPPSDDLYVEDSWDEPVTLFAPPAAGDGPVDSEPSLAERVESLERYIRDQEESKTASTNGASPDAQKKQNGDQAGAVKKAEAIAKPTQKWRGRIFVDGISYDDDDDTAAFFGTDRENEFGFDTVRLGVQGDIHDYITYVLEVEFEGTEVDFKDVFVEMYSLPLIGHLRAGHFKEPIGLEELTSSRFNTFMERSYATLTFAPGRKYGVMLFNSLDPADYASWFLGTFRHESDDSPTGTATQRDDSNDWSLASRFAWLPYYDEASEGRYFMHLGGSYSYRNAASPAQFGTGAYIGNQPPIGVGALAGSDHWNQVGTEFAVVWGPTSVQAEYFHAFVTSGEEYYGAYVQLSYFLTGEHRGYNKPTKAFYRVHPFEPALWIDTTQGWCCGPGAWELAAAYSFVNLEDGVDVAAGVAERALVDGFIVGVNWYLNPYSRVMLNYNLELTDFVDDGTPDSNASIFGARWQVDW